MGDDLASTLRERRRALGLRQSALARRAGVSASYLSRLEGAAWERGGPWPSDSTLRSLARSLDLSSTELIELRERAREESDTPRLRRARPTTADGYAVVLGNERSYQAVGDLVARNPSGGSLRTVDAFVLDYPSTPAEPVQLAFWDRVADRLADEPATILYRVCTSTPEHFPLIRDKTARLAGGRAVDTIGNIRTRFCLRNPLVLDIVVSEHEAFLGVPGRSGHPSLRAGLIIDDPDLVAALRSWYDEFVWESSCDCTDVRYATMPESLDTIEQHLRATAGHAGDA